jgi:two-component system, LytTR family, sensor kinase
MRPSLKRPGWLVLASRTQVPPGRIFWALQCVGWGALAAVMLGRSLEVTDLRVGLVDVGALVASGVLVSLLWRAALRSIRSTVPKPILFSATAGAAAIVGGFIWNTVNLWVLDAASGFAAGGPMASIDPPGTLHGLWIRTALLVAWGLLYLAIKAWMDLELARERAVRAELAAQTARLSALQSQMQPHFIFNSLNAISTLVGDGRNPEARAALSLLGDFLRKTMTMRDTPEITVAEEMEFLRLYLELIELRFGDRLRSRIDVDPEALSSLFPCLLLQPLVENAVRHGLQPRDSVGTVDIKIATTPSGMLFTVEDDGIGLKKKTGFSPGLGLSNTATRLGDLYGSAASLTIRPRDGGGVRVEIQLPRRSLQTAYSDHAIAEEVF